MALTPWTSLSQICKSKVQNCLWFVKGVGTNEVYPLEVDPATGAIPVSGTISATNPSVSATGAPVPAQATMVGGSDGTDLWAIKVAADGTVAVSAASLPLPTGASTAAKQPALGTAGTASADVITVQGIASMTPLLVNGSAFTQPVSGTVAVSNFPATQPVSGTVAATQSGTWTVTQSGTWNIGTVTTVTTVGAVTAITNALPAGTAILGKVGIDQTTPGTTNAVAVTSQVAQTTTTAVFQAEASVAFGSITTSFVTLFTPTAATKMIQFRNGMNQPVIVSLDAGSTTNYVFDPGDALSLDLLANALNMGATAIQVKYTGTAPTAGSFRINGCH